MRRLLLRFLGVLAAGVLVCWRATLRVRVEDDPRPGLRAAGRRYVYAILHAQQLSFILLSDDVPILAMVSASRDGDWLVPLCRVRRIIPVRGSTGKRGVDKGGRAALAKLADGVRKGLPALLAVDGPRGPRSRADSELPSIRATSMTRPACTHVPPRSCSPWSRPSIPTKRSTRGASPRAGDAARRPPARHPDLTRLNRRLARSLRLRYAAREPVHSPAARPVRGALPLPTCAWRGLPRRTVP